MNVELVIAMVLMAVVGVAALKYMGIWGCFVLAAMAPYAKELIDKL